MGTRGFVSFVADGTEKTAYNRFDSYPEGLGIGVLGWLRSAATDIDALRESVKALRVVDPNSKPTPEDIERLTSEQVWATDEPEEYPAEYAALTDEQKAKAAEYREAVKRVLSWHGRMDTPGIPHHKFSTNDGWHVLPAECEAAVRIWDDFVKAKGEVAALKFVAAHVGSTDYWLAWIAYLRGAVRHGGFEVH